MTFDQNMLKTKNQKKITKIRLKNIGLYYLQRFESSVQNLRDVLKRRVDKYAFSNPEFDKTQAYAWIEELLEDFQRLNYLNDERYALMKINDFLSVGKSAKYIKMKLMSKGIEAKTVEALMEQCEYDPKALALKLAEKKKIGPYRKADEERKKYFKKDMGILLRAGFDYETVCDIMRQELEN